MRWAFIAIVGIFGCSFRGSASGSGVDAAPDSSTDALPDAASDDPDRDGIKTPIDNCPQKSNPLQANDDGDIHGDACDPCPWKANEATDDVDEDQLTDECDPDPRYPDQLIYFEGFDKLRAGATLPLGWNALSASGQWAVSTKDGALVGVHPSGAGNGPALVALDLGASAFSARLYVRTLGLFVDARNNHRQAGVIGDLEIASGAAVAGAICDITLDSGKSVAGYFRQADVSVEGNSVGNRAAPVSLRLTVERGGARKVLCDAKGQNASSATSDDDPIARAGTGLGFRVSNGTATYQYLAAYRLNTLSQPPSSVAP
jgi:hypothetical protein